MGDPTSALFSVWFSGLTGIPTQCVICLPQLQSDTIQNFSGIRVKDWEGGFGRDGLFDGGVGGMVF